MARCTVNYVGRLTAHLPEAIRVIMVKADGSVLIHSDGGSYKPLNWMSPPCVTKVLPAEFDTDESTWVVENKAGERLLITIHETLSESDHALGIDPGLQKDGVEAHLRPITVPPSPLIWRKPARRSWGPSGPEYWPHSPSQ